MNVKQKKPSGFDTHSHWPGKIAIHIRCKRGILQLYFLDRRADCTDSGHYYIYIYANPFSHQTPSPAGCWHLQSASRPRPPQPLPAMRLLRSARSAPTQIRDLACPPTRGLFDRAGCPGVWAVPADDLPSPEPVPDRRLGGLVAAQARPQETSQIDRAGAAVLGRSSPRRTGSGWRRTGASRAATLRGETTPAHHRKGLEVQGKKGAVAPVVNSPPQARTLWTERYETLRQYVLEGCPVLGTDPLGLILLFQRGVAGWMRCWAQLVEPAFPRSVSLLPPSTTLPAPWQNPLTVLLAQMTAPHLHCD